jgi:FkbM family methyltransferase
MKLSDRLTCGVAQARGHHFIGRALGNSAVVLDLGANMGDFARQIESRWDARCLCVEANPALCAQWDAPGEVINAAVAGYDAEIDFLISTNAEASSFYENGQLPRENRVKIRALTLESVMTHAVIANASLVKMDIEGAEIDVLTRVSAAGLSRCQQISVEFHDFCLPNITAYDVARVKRRMHEAGFWCISFSCRNTDVLFVNKQANVLSWYEYVWIAYVIRYVLGLGRMLRRWTAGQVL